MSLFKQNFVFKASRYEEWQDQRCISQGPIDTKIIAKVDAQRIHFELIGADNLRIMKKFSFILDASCDMGYRLQYVTNSDFNPIAPVVCHVFMKSQLNIDYVRFAMTNPNRLIEFYGVMTDYGESEEEFVDRAIAMYLNSLKQQR